jgi:DnaJ-class molecular chaperone
MAFQVRRPVCLICVSDDKANAHKSYSFSGDPIEIFENFFGTTNPFHIALDKDGSQITLIDKIESDIHKDYIKEESIAGEDLVVTAFCTLNEFFFGTTKRITYTVMEDASTSITMPR